MQLPVQVVAFQLVPLGLVNNGPLPLDDPLDHHKGLLHIPAILMVLEEDNAVGHTIFIWHCDPGVYTLPPVGSAGVELPEAVTEAVVKLADAAEALDAGLSRCGHIIMVIITAVTPVPLNLSNALLVTHGLYAAVGATLGIHLIDCH